MTIAVDLFLLETWQRFQDFCFHVARAEYATTGLVVQLGLSWDGGRDVVVIMHADTSQARALALQSKFTRSCGSSTKRSILRSLEAMSRLDGPSRPGKFILCMPIDPTGGFLDWFRLEMERRKMPYDVWGRAELLARLEKRPDIFETFFYRVFAELQQAFVTDELELRRFSLDRACEWRQRDPHVLSFRSAGTDSPDLVLDLIVRNRGRMEAVVTKIVAEVGEWSPVPRGIPPAGLLFPKITYSVSLGGGAQGRHEHLCEPPLLVRASRNERFKIRLTETGCTWTGVVRLGIDYGDKMLLLPCLRLIS